MSQESQNGRHVIRRGVLVVAGLVSAVGVLTACSTKAVPYDSNEAGTAIIAGADTTEIPITPSATAVSGTSGTSGGGTSSGSSGSTANGTVLSVTSDIPVGGGVIAADKIVITQPVKGEFKAFSAVCSPSGSTATEVADGTIDCSSQGAKFSITTGDPVAGPIKTPLAAEKITVANGEIELLG